MWSAVASRLHTPQKIYPFGSDSNEFMLHGVVNYTLKDGRKVEVEWAGKGVLAKEADVWKFAFYQVYLVSYLSFFIILVGKTLWKLA
jgi:hypothetical protein